MKEAQAKSFIVPQIGNLKAGQSSESKEPAFNEILTLQPNSPRYSAVIQNSITKPKQAVLIDRPRRKENSLLPYVNDLDNEIEEILKDVNLIMKHCVEFDKFKGTDVEFVALNRK